MAGIDNLLFLFGGKGSMQRIYLHGLGQTPDSWEKTIIQLKHAEHSVCPDLVELIRGQDATYQNLYNAFSELCSRFDGKIDLCGLSLGGVLALNYAGDHPEKVNSLVLIAAQYKMPRGMLRIQNILFRFMPKAMFRQMGFSKAEILQLCRTMAELDLGNQIRRIDCPALVICGEKDTANMKAARELTGIIRNAKLQVIGGSGHEVNIDAPEALAGILYDFFSKVK